MGTDTTEFLIIAGSYGVLLLNGYLTWRLWKRADVSLYLVVAVTFTVSLWNIPLLTRPIVSLNPVEINLITDDYQFYFGYLIELVATASVLSFLVLWRKPYMRSVLRMSSAGPPVGDFTIIATAVIGMIVAVLYAPYFLQDYLESN